MMCRPLVVVVAPVGGRRGGSEARKVVVVAPVEGAEAGAVGAEKPSRPTVTRATMPVPSPVSVVSHFFRSVLAV